MRENLQLSGGEDRELPARLTVLSNAAPTFRASDNEVRWELTVHVDIKGWPNLEESYVVDVHPS